jgi:hypothetical protein
MARENDHITEIRMAATELINALNHGHAMRAEWDARGYADSEVLGDVFTGSNADVTHEEIAAFIGTTLDALEALMAQGHATNTQAVRL